MTAPQPPRAASGRPWLRKSAWFVALWCGGVVAALLVATVFKVLILGAVQH
ncbi:MAG: DUF2474 domain-containing protein [Dyella sp.]